jgi:hypothetical protein
MTAILVRDEIVGGHRETATIELRGVPTVLTLRELITLRVREEMTRRDGPSNRLWEREAEVTCRAFQRNGFFVLVGGKQVRELDDLVDLSDDPEVAFVRLVPLAGG